ncbi:MAG: type I-B CRISPR-associated protein Cas8b1/Cst1 [Sulfurihydrogenibium sp.]|jgi:CRISPR-associated protein Cst1|nr:type I-B CRISPR-associated protein Cas8b1/Cst1 [Sulfurihydrogenibium sp.]
MERIYLGEWLYNAGIVGFLRINNHLWEVKNEKLISKNENLLKIGDNYIEIDRKIFEGFTDRFFNYAFSLYSKYNVALQHLRRLISSLNNSTFEKISKDFNRLLKDYPILEKKVKERIGDFKAKDCLELSSIMENALKIMKEDKADFIEDFIENEIRKFLSTHYGQKSFLNRGVKEDKRQRFYEDFEKPLLENKKSSKHKHRCVVCGDRPAKENLSFDTGLSTIFGLNRSAVNFLWDFDERIPVCDICEVIYFCTFAGLTELNGKYYFVNQDNTVEDLFISAGRFEKELKRDYDEKLNDFLFVEFITDFLIHSKKLQSEYIIQNINFIEVEIKKLSMSEKRMVKVFNFNIDRSTAEFIKENYEDFKSLSRSYFVFPDDKTKVYVLAEFLNSVLKKNLSYEFLYKIFRSKIKDRAYISYNNLLKLINMYLLYLKKIGGNEMDLEERNLRAMYMQGRDLLIRLKQNNAENKVQSIIYKLLNALKTGDVKQFMDMLIRIHASYNLKVPELVLKAMEDKDSFYLLGYSFLSGLLGKEYQTKEENR